MIGVQEIKSRIKALVKSNRIVYYIYFYFGSLAIRFLGLFVRTNPNLILFVSYGGKKYDDSPKVVYEYLNEHPVSDKHEYVWAFVNPEDFPEVTNKVRIDTLEYYITALKAKYWITNSSVARGLKFKKKETKNILFPHGMTGVKKIGTHIATTKGTYRQAYKEAFDLVFCEGTFEDEILKDAWGFPIDVFHKTGFPRNDDLVNVSEEEILQLKKRIGIPLDKKVILYAPTFREQQRDKHNANALSIPIGFLKWKERLGDKWVLLITAHYEVAKIMTDMPNDPFVVKAFHYPYINDLIKVSDVLISDYSSIVFDFSIMERPILCYGYDYQQYKQQRGVYTELEELFSHGVCKTEEEVITAIEEMDYCAECQYTKEKIKDKYIASYGNAAQKSVEIIFSDEIYKPNR